MTRPIVIKAEDISKQYRLGQVGTGTLSHDLNRFWHRMRGKEDPYLMARCGYRLANLYIRMNEPQKAQWAASFIPPIRGMEGARALIRKWTTPQPRVLTSIASVKSRSPK